MGPESTGKTTAALKIAKALEGFYVPEFARTYLADIGLDYTESDVHAIARLQIQAELDAILYHPYTTIILDTELITIEIWLEFYHMTVPDWIPLHIRSCDYRYLLFDTDIPWTPDELRNNPHDRAVLLESFKQKLNHYEKKYEMVKEVDALI